MSQTSTTAPSTVKKTPPRLHNLGAAGHLPHWKASTPLKFELGLNPDLIKTATDYGGRLSRDETGAFTLQFAGGEDSFDYTGDLAGLKTHLAFLRQPIRSSMTEYIWDDAPFDRYSAQAYTSDAQKRGKDFKTWVAKFARKNKIDVKKAEDITLSVLNKQIREQQELTHKILRYALTGSSIMLEFRHPSLDDDINSCHAKTEQEIRTNNMFANTGEIDATGRVESYNADEEKEPLETAILPGTRFHPGKGFEFRLHEQIQSNEQTVLGQWFWDNVDAVTAGRYENDDRPDVIHLTPDEFKQFCKQVHTAINEDNIAEIVAEMNHQERLAALIERVDERVPEIRLDREFQRLKAQREGHVRSPQARLKRMALTSTALTAILSDEVLQDRWAHYFYTQRKKPPMGKIIDNIKLLKDALEHYDGENLSAEHLEALASDEEAEIYDVLAFGTEMFSTLETALTDISKNPDEHKELAQALAYMKEAFADGSLAPIAQSDDQMSYHCERVLDITKRSTGQGDGAATYMGKQFVENTVDFLTDLYSHPLQGGKYTAGFALVCAWLYYKMSTDPSEIAIPEAHDVPSSAVITEDTGLDFSDDFGDEAPSANDLEGVEGIDYDIHYTLWGEYKHYFNESVIGTSKTALGYVDATLTTTSDITGLPGLPEGEKSDFLQSAHTASEKMGFLTRVANNIQNFGGHMIMFASLGLIGLFDGPRGMGKLLSFFDGFHDAGRALLKERPLAALAIPGLIYDRMPAGPEGMTSGFFHALALGAIGYSVSPKLFKKNLPKPDQFVNDLTKNARAIMEALKHQSENGHTFVPENRNTGPVRAATISLKYRHTVDKDDTLLARAWQSTDNALRRTRLKNTGLRQTFNITAQNYALVMETIMQMDFALNVFGEHMGADNPLYNKYLKEKIGNLLTGFNDYQERTINEGQLENILQENLRDVIGAQMYLNGSSPIYESLYDRPPEPKHAKFLRHYGSNRHGHYNRIARIQAAEDKTREIKREKIVNQFSNDWKMKLYQDYRITGQSLKMLWNEACDKTAYAFRGAQNTYGNIPHKKKIAGILAAFFGTAALMNSGGYQGQGHEIVDTLASGGGVVLGGTTTSAAFLVVNVVDDQIVVHMGLGGTFMAAGAGLHYPYKYVAVPAFNYGKEWIQNRNHSPAPH